MAAKANSKSKNTKKSSSSTKRTSSGSSTSRSRASSSSRTTVKQKEAQSRRVKDIAMILIIGVCVLMFLSFFSKSLFWLKDGLYFCFGKLLYIIPFVIIILMLVISFAEINIELVKRLIASVLLLFAVSGIVSIATGNVDDGGLLGRGNYALLHKTFGSIGSYIINAILVLISIVFFIDFSVFEFAGKQYQKTSKRYAENREFVRKKREKQNEMRERHQQEIDEYRRKKRERELENEERFSPVKGIGDTTITDTSDNGPTVFLNTEKGSEAKDHAQFGPYSVPRRKEKEELTIHGIEKKQEPEKEAGFPDFDIDEDFFETAEQDPASGFRPSSAKNAADASSEGSLPYLDDEDHYTKTVITANGKVMNVETDGNILKNKTVYNGSVNNPVKNAQGTAGTSSGKTAAPSASAVETVVVEKPVKEPTKEYRFPPMNKLRHGSSAGSSRDEIQAEIKETAAKLQQTLAIFGVGATVTHVSYGPAVTRYELQPELGVKVSRILSLTDDIKLSLAAADIRIEAPIPGKSAIGIEVPNKVTQSVVLRDLLETDAFRNTKSKLAFPAGKDIEGNIIIADIAKMPHVLVAGATGSGKSVCINTMIMSILYHAKPTEVKMIMIDPKVVELSVYNGIPHLLMPVVTDAKKAAGALNWAVAEMERRYAQFAEFGVRGIEGFNTLIDTDQIEDEEGNPIVKMPQILIIVDELADLMMVSPKDVEDAICRLAQKARAAGLHLVLATQRPSVDVITGLIKANIPSRIAFAVSSGVDSRTILDMNGAEKLLGKGDMLYDPAGAPKPLRVQGAFVSDGEINDVVTFIQNQGPVKGMSTTSVDLSSGSVNGTLATAGGNDRDEYFPDAGRLVIEKEKASIGMLQRAFKLGFNRAARIMDQLEDAGVVGAEEGTKPRKVNMTIAEFEDFLNS